MPNQRCDNRPEDVSLEVFLKEAPKGSACFVFFFRKRQGPRIDVRVFLDDVWMRVMLNVVFFSPIIHRKARKQRERQGSKGQVACLRFASRRVNPFVADHGDGGGDQAGDWEKNQPPLQGEVDVCGVQQTDDGQQNQNLGPGFGCWFVQQPLFLQFFAQFCHWMCSHLHHQRSRRYPRHGLEPKKVVFPPTPIQAIRGVGNSNDATRCTAASNDNSWRSEGSHER